jgi:Transposase and inactivated derivatives
MKIQAQNREQTVLYSSLEDLISTEHPVRIIDYLIESLQKKNPETYKYKGESTTGRPAYPVTVMLKLFIYGCINRINSSRRLETETKRNIELMWLLGNLTPDFKTIADFRKDNKELIKKCSKDVRTFLKCNGLVSCELISIDGTRLKANANRDMLSESEIIKRIVGLEEYIEYYINQMDCLDDQETEETSTIVRMQEDYEKRITTMQSEINLLRSALDKLQSDNKNYISLTDFDCSKQKSRDGIIPGYNVQIACDTKYGFIVADDVTVESNDINQLKPMVNEIQSELEISPITTIADTGYCNYDDIEEIEARGGNCFVPPQKEQIKNSDITFTYQEDNDRYICSEGKYLILKRKNKKYKNSYINVYVGESCQTCPLVEQCTESKTGRHISRYQNQDYRDRHREKMETSAAKCMSKIRKSTIEPIFGTLKVWLGKIPLLTRGKPNVKTEIKILTISFNIKKLMSLFSFKEIMSMINRYLGLDCQRTFNFSFIFIFFEIIFMQSIMDCIIIFSKKTLFNRYDFNLCHI